MTLRLIHNSLWRCVWRGSSDGRGKESGSERCLLRVGESSSLAHFFTVGSPALQKDARDKPYVIPSGDPHAMIFS